MHSSRLLVLFSLVLSSGLVRSDYPPPEEDGHAYYSAYRENGEGGRGGGVSFVGDWSDRDWQVLHNHNHPKCLEIPSNLTLCHNIGYGQMRLPNLLEHDTLKEATQQASTWVRLAQIGCHPDTQIFLCSLFAPVCLDQPVWPCRTLCEAVKGGCESRMLQYGFPWPDMLRCDKFPQETDLCIRVRNDRGTENATCPVCSTPDSADQVINSLCQADFVIRAKVDRSLVTGNDLKVTVSKKKKVFRTGSLKAKELRDGVVFLEGGADCDCPVLDTVNGRRSDDQVVVAGNRTGDHRLVVSSIQSVRSKGIRQILRDLRRKVVCRTGRTSPERKQNKKKKAGKSSKPGEVEQEGAPVKRKNQKEAPGKDNDNRGNRKDNRRGNRTPEGHKASGQRSEETGQTTEGEREREEVMTSARPARRSTNPGRRQGLVSAQPKHRT